MGAKKGQLKMFETIGVLIVFFILLAIGISVYFVIQKSSATKETVQRQQTEGFKIAQKMLYLPELDCNFLSTTQDVCFDLYKLQTLQDLLNKDENIKNDYFQIFGYSKITINIVYPQIQPQFVLYDKQPPAIVTQRTTQSPILVKNPIDDTNSFGYVEVKRYFAS